MTAEERAIPCDCLACAEATGDWLKVLYSDLRKPWCKRRNQHQDREGLGKR